MIEVIDVSYRYPKSSTYALKNVNLNIEDKSCFGLIGPNGAGKTTLISTLTGLLPVQSGQVRILGVDINKNPNLIKQSLAYVPQEYAFYPAMSAWENLQCFAGFYQIPAKDRTRLIEFCIETCSLSHVIHQRAKHYSGGVKRRLNIALGLLRSPKVLFLDEPTVGIDAQSRLFILDTIKTLNEAGMCVIYTSHYMEEVEKICDSIAIIDQGTVTLQSNLQTLLNADNSLYLTLKSQPKQQDLLALEKQFQITAKGNQLSIYLSDNMSLSILFKQLEILNMQVQTISQNTNRLENIYLDHTARTLRQ